MKYRGSWAARVSYLDHSTGRMKQIRKAARTKAEAQDLLPKMLAEAESLSRGDNAGKAPPVTFAQLAERFLEDYVHEAEYMDERKVSGLRSWKTVRGNVAILKKRIGTKRLSTITHGTLLSLRRELIGGDTKKGTPRTIASTNRIMAILRRIIGIAERNGWMTRNPFTEGDPLVTVGDERPREVVISRNEEAALLAAIRSDPKRQHIEPFVIAALDTGCRSGELKQLEWGDVDVARRTIVIRAMSTKTLRRRQVPMTKRVFAILLALRDSRTLQGDAGKLLSLADAADALAIHPAYLYQAVTGRRGEKAAARYLASRWQRIESRWFVDEATVFDIRRPKAERVFDSRDLQKHFAAARAEAGLAHVRIHDCRHTAATRLIQGGMPIVEVMRVLGHTTLMMSYRYTNADAGTIARASAILSGSVPIDERKASRLKRLSRLAAMRTPKRRQPAEVN